NLRVVVELFSHDILSSCFALRKSPQKTSSAHVIPTHMGLGRAEGGEPERGKSASQHHWIPAFAGMTISGCGKSPSYFLGTNRAFLSEIEQKNLISGPQ
ncbi:MAG: hypothetical protein L3K26_07645, partial [Candidatus Hydrogenedentes bacterium]|nr:hypothetical protein [Candidatus Hydrogenedentota bacterium]